MSVRRDQELQQSAFQNGAHWILSLDRRLPESVADEAKRRYPLPTPETVSGPTPEEGTALNVRIVMAFYGGDWKRVSDTEEILIADALDDFYALRKAGVITLFADAPDFASDPRASKRVEDEIARRGPSIVERYLMALWNAVSDSVTPLKLSDAVVNAGSWMMSSRVVFALLTADCATKCRAALAAMEGQSHG